MTIDCLIMTSFIIIHVLIDIMVSFSRCTGNENALMMNALNGLKRKKEIRLTFNQNQINPFESVVNTENQHLTHDNFKQFFFVLFSNCRTTMNSAQRTFSYVNRLPFNTNRHFKFTKIQEQKNGLNRKKNASLRFN